MIKIINITGYPGVYNTRKILFSSGEKVHLGEEGSDACRSQASFNDIFADIGAIPANSYELIFSS
ncbi:hypothetical protein DCM91_01040 [Chitinophaga costaii]|nr:hypothetical protein DCM91_01040 [Chitinophaga costaii]